MPPALPNLICVGLEKSGTTLLYEVFRHSPQILTSRKKELFFFNLNYEEGLDWYRQWWQHSDKPDASYTADITPSYFRRRGVVERIAQCCPEAKLLVLVRHPVYRSLSHYVHRIRHVAPNLEGYSHSLWQELEGRGARTLLFPLYDAHLSWLLEFFPRDQILLLNYEQDIQNPASAQSKLNTFLGGDAVDFSVLGARKVNDGKMPQFYYGGHSGVSNRDTEGEFHLPPQTLLLAHAKGDRVWTDIDPATAERCMAAAQNWTSALSSDEIQRIWREYYEQDSRQFCERFDMDLEPWLTDTPVSYAPATPGRQFRTR